jgi:histidinol-phosphate aminotransferase
MESQVVTGAMTLRLHLNENTGGCSPAVLAAIRGLDPLDAAIYPDYSEITAACERWFQVPAGWVQLTNGLDEGLHAVAQRARVTHRGGQTPSALIVEPAFEMYEICAEAAGLDVTRVLWDPRERFPLDAIVSALTDHTRLIYLTDPNNPTGLPIPPGAIERIAAAALGALVLVDEAYAEFSGRTCIGTPLDRHRNLVTGRTFAKAHGLAALRAGALIAHPDTLAPLRRILPPFGVSICAVRALGAALGDRPYLDQYVAQSVESRRLIYAFGDRHGFHYWKSEANFVLIELGPAAPAVVAALAGRGILIRDRSGQPGCAGCVRITAGVVEHTRRCLEAMNEILAGGLKPAPPSV